MRFPHHLGSALAGVVAIACLVAIAGCSARTNIGATGTAPAEVAHLWVTVEEVGFAVEADTPPESQTGWTRETLSNPVVIDLANVDPGTLVSLVSNLSVRAGQYRQLYLGVAESSDRLVSAARAVGLEYNAQVDIVDEDGGISTAPLEFPVPGVGLAIPVDLTFEDASGLGVTNRSAGEITNLAITLDAARDVVTYEYGGNTGYILSPSASVDDVAAAGEIRGSVDTSGLAADHPAITVSAQVQDDTGTHRVVVQRRGVAADGSFSLAPLPAAKQGGTLYDVVITCAGADTVIVRDVPVNDDGALTTLQSTPIVLTPAGTVYADAAVQSTSLPAGTRVEFYQTLPGSDGLPHVIDGTALDPLTRQLPGNAFALPAGSLVVGTYANGDPISFSTATPDEGSGGYVVGTAGLYRVDTLDTDPVDITGTSSRPSQVVAPYPEIVDGGRSGSLTVNILVPAERFNKGFVTVSAGHRVMETVSVDALLAFGGGAITVTGLPAGSALAPVAGVPYQVALRAWNSRNPAGTITTVAGGASVLLGDGGSGAVSLQVR